MKKIFKNVGLAILMSLLSLVSISIIFTLAVLINNWTQILVTGNSWIPGASLYGFFLLILLISYYLLKSKVSTFWKAGYSAVPILIIYLFENLLLYRWSLALYPVFILVGIGLFYFLKRTKQSWHYYYTFISVSAILLVYMFLYTGF